jgi:hypothetical protein
MLRKTNLGQERGSLARVPSIVDRMNWLKVLGTPGKTGRIGTGPAS